nr:Nif3-like dinuclear metal center hexameric protein [Bowmanella yangjiangensis]
MTISRQELCQYLDNLLSPGKIKDYCPNGLQVEGRNTIHRVVTGVTASQALIDAAIEQQADAILVHHGYFWRGEDATIRGMRKQRLASLLKHDINLLAYHLPLDIHPVLGNNAQLAKLLDIQTEGGLEADNPQSVAMRGRFAEPLDAQAIARRIEAKLGRVPLVEATDKPIKTVAWCTGGGQSFIDLAAEQGIDAFISGEVSEQTIHVARECGIAFFAAGHHATERYGAKALGEHLAKELGLAVTFVDIPNPA